MVDGRPAENKRAILFTTSLVSSLIMLDSNIVAVSLPSLLCFLVLVLALGRLAHAPGVPQPDHAVNRRARRR